jgi:hypothetical protein
MDIRNSIVKYLVDERCEGNVEKAADLIGCSDKQISDWLNGAICPQKQTIEYIIHKLFVPEFKVIVEFGKFDPTKPVLPQLRNLLIGHEERSGIFAFYDSMANLLYVGKATNLLNECYSAIRRNVDIQFPSGVKNKPSFRYEIVKYISAYDVGASDWVDLPRHVESLVLRISKPPLNKQIGYLEELCVQPTDS